MTSEERLAEVKGQVRDRLKNICSHLSEDDFERLVQKIADNEIKSPSTTSSKIGYTWKLPKER